MRILARFDKRIKGEEAFSALLGLGIAESDLSLLVPVETQGGFRQIDMGNGGFMEAPDAGFIDPASEAGYVGSGLGLPRIEAEGSMLLESSVGGGVSTSSPDDDVSSVQEMDDSESTAEAMLYPEAGESFSSQDAHDIERLAQTGSVDITGIGPSGVSGSAEAEEIALDSLYQDLSVILLPGWGAVFGDGGLATDLTAAAIKHKAARDPRPDLGTVLASTATPRDASLRLVDCWGRGGAILEASLPVEESDALGVERVIVDHGGVIEQSG